MKTIKTIFAVTVTSLALASLNTFAADSTTGGQGTGSGSTGMTRPAERPSVPPVTAVVRPDRVQLPEDVKTAIKEFETAREKFLADQTALFKQLAAASETDRAAIREQIRSNREEMMTATKEIREQIRTRLQELRTKMPNRQEILDQAGPRPGGRPGTQ